MSENIYWKEMVLSIGGMIGFYLLYKLITLIILYSFEGLQSKPYYQVIYFLIIIVVSMGVYVLSKKFFNKKIELGINWRALSKTKGLIFIVPFILYGLDLAVILPQIFKQPIELILTSFLSAIGAGIFEEIRDRGFGINGLTIALPTSKWKSLMIAVISSAIFSLTHYFNLFLPNRPTINATNQQVFYTFFLGMCLAVLAVRTGTLFYNIIFHFMNNFTVWSPTFDIAQDSPWFSLVIIYGLIPLIFSIWCLRPKMSDKILDLMK